MTTTHEHKCWTCGGAGNAANFGALCDRCARARKARLASAARILRDYGQSESELGRALAHHGYHGA